MQSVGARRTSLQGAQSRSVMVTKSCSPLILFVLTLISIALFRHP